MVDHEQLDVLILKALTGERLVLSSDEWTTHYHGLTARLPYLRDTLTLAVSLQQAIDNDTIALTDEERAKGAAALAQEWNTWLQLDP